MSRLELESPVQGSIWKLLVATGDVVAQGQVVVIVESMKVEIPIESPAAGRVVELLVAPEQPIEEDEVLLVLDTAIDKD